MDLLKSFDIEKAVDDIAAAVQCERCFGNVEEDWRGGLLPGRDAGMAERGAAADRCSGGLLRRKDYAIPGERPKVPVMLHFGEQDQHIPQSEIDAIAKAYPEVPIYTYPAGHAFNREGSAGYDAASCATRARARTLEFLREHLR